jgi:hypothetical protein
VIELAKRDAKSNAQILECVESVDLEVGWELYIYIYGVCVVCRFRGMLRTTYFVCV